MLQIAVLGAGNHSSQMHGPALKRYRDEYSTQVELCAVCDRDPDRRSGYADRFGFTTTYASLERMCEEEPLDAVIAVTPVAKTRELVGELLTHDVAVLIEKPPGDSVAEAQELQQIASRNDSSHAVSLNRRFNPAVVRARKWIEEHAQEPPTHGISRLLRDHRFEPTFRRNTGIHTVDMGCSFLGTPESVTVENWDSQTEQEHGHGASAHVLFPAATAHFTMFPHAGTRDETCELFGPGYTVDIDVEGAALTITQDGITVKDWQLNDAPAYVRNGTLNETHAFLRAVERGDAFGPTLEEVIPSMELAWAIHECEDRSFG